MAYAKLLCFLASELWTMGIYSFRWATKPFRVIILAGNVLRHLFSSCPCWQTKHEVLSSRDKFCPFKLKTNRFHAKISNVKPTSKLVHWVLLLYGLVCMDIPRELVELDWTWHTKSEFQIHHFEWARVVERICCRRLKRHVYVLTCSFIIWSKIGKAMLGAVIMTIFL